MRKSIELLAVLGLCTALLQACTMRETDPASRLPWQLPSEEVVLEKLPAPAELGAFRYKGQMDNPEAEVRVLRYNHRDGDHRLDITLYPMPPGWDTMEPRRVVSGLHSEVQGSMTQRALRRGAEEFTVQEHEFHPGKNNPYPVLSSRVKQAFEGKSRIAFVELSARKPILMHAIMSVPEDQAEGLGGAVHEALLAYLEAMMAAEAEQPATREDSANE